MELGRCKRKEQGNKNDDKKSDQITTNITNINLIKHLAILRI